MRSQPHSLEAEQGVLSCCMVDPKAAIPQTSERLKTAEAFYDARHQLVWTAMCTLSAASKGIDIITISTCMADLGTLEQIGGLSYLSTIYEAACGIGNLSYYLETVHAKYLLRRMLGICNDIASGIYGYPEHDTDPSEFLDHAEAELMKLNAERVMSREVHIKAIITDTLDRLDHYQRGGPQMIGLSTGFAYLDKMTCGLAPGQMFVLGGRPGEGKTSMGMQICAYVSESLKLPTVVFSLEMTKQELGSRLLYQVTPADYQRYRTGYALNEDLPRLTMRAPSLAAAPLWIDDTGGQTIMEIRAKARRMFVQYGIKLIMIDYLQLISGEGKFRDRLDAVAFISAGIKTMAKELNIPVLVMAQLNRDIEKEVGRKPKLSDLRECGSIENDGDVVAMLYKPKYAVSAKDGEKPSPKPDWSAHSIRVNLLIAKQRNGPTGDDQFLFRKDSMRFTEYSESKCER